MKFVQVLKSVAMASALVAAGSSFAASVTVDATTSPVKLLASTGAMNLSNDSDPTGSSVTGAFGLINSSLQAAVQAYAPATAVFGTDANGNETAAAVAPIVGLKYDSTTMQVTDVYSLGGLTLNAAVTGASKGGSVTITNIHADLTTKTMYADIIGTPTYSGGVAFVHNQMAFYTWVTTVGSTAVPTVAAGQTITLSNSLQGLAATTAFKTDLTNAMGLKGIGLSTLNALTNYGSLDSTITVQGVPEPSTYALMGLGLAGAGFVARRRSRQA